MAKEIKLFGRKDEYSSLVKIYQGVKNTGSFGKVTVCGHSGTGKTSLVTALRHSVIADNGLFCSSKCFQGDNLGREPYSAIMAAFSDLCDLVLQSRDFDDQRRAMIMEELGTDGKLLLSTVTNLSPFFHNSEEDLQYTFDTSFTNMHYCSAAKMKNACKSFVRAMCSNGNKETVVIFIDDIQWVDEESKDILEALLQDTSIHNFMLILAYREDEDFEIDNAFEPPIKFDLNVQLFNLDSEGVKSIALNYLSIESDRAPRNIGMLCDLIAQRTQSNPFHIKQFLDLIKTKKLITYDDQSNTWLFDIDNIQRRTMIDESIAETISKKVNLLDKATAEVLKTLSLLGYCFTHRMAVDFCSEHCHEGFDGKNLSLEEILEKATESNLIEKTSNGYQFTHDKIQSSFLGIMDDKEKQNRHLTIGNKFLRRQALIFKYLAAIHLNCAAKHFSNNFEGRLFLAKVNFQASNYCESRYAFADALNFVRKGLNLLGDGEEKWLADFDMTCSMIESLAKLEYISGNINACRCANREILDRATSDKQRVNAVFREINALIISKEDDIEVISLGKKILNQLGIEIPQIVTPLHFMCKLKKLRKLIDKKGDDEFQILANLRYDLVCAVRVTNLTSIFFMKHKKYLMVLYSHLLALEFTMSNGLCIYSAETLVQFGEVEMTLGQKERAYRLWRLSLQLVSRDTPAHIVTQVRIMVGILSQRELIKEKDSFLFTPKELNAFLEEGSVVVATMCGMFSFLARQLGGEHLESLENSVGAVYERLRDLDQQVMNDYFQLFLQFLSNLRNEDDRDWKKLTILSKEHLTEAECKARFPSWHRNYFLNASKLTLAYLFGQYKEASQIHKTVKADFKHKNSFVAFPLYMYNSLTFFALYEATGYRKHVRKARSFRKVLQRQHALGNSNATPYLQLVEAVELSLKPDTSMAQIRSKFESVIEIQVKENMTHLEAMANEHAGFALLRMEKNIATNGSATSTAFLQRAMDVYRNKWGAIAKYRWLSEKISLQAQ